MLASARVNMVGNSMADSLLRVDLEIDRVVNQFEQALRRGELVQIEDCAARNSVLGTRLTRELVLTEIEFRRSRNLPIHWDDYSIRFPEIVSRIENSSVHEWRLRGRRHFEFLAKSRRSLTHRTSRPRFWMNRR